MKSLFNQLKKACAFTALLTSLSAAALPADYYAPHSVLAEGRWVKVRVSQTGMQQITASELEAMGFSDPNAVAVYGYGGALLNSHLFSTDIPDDLQPQPSIVAEGKLIFYGEASRDVRLSSSTLVSISENFYSNDGYYFLTDRFAPVAPAEIPYSSSASRNVTRSVDVQFYGPDRLNPHSCGAFFFEHELTLNQPYTITFNLPDFDGTVPMFFRYNAAMSANSGSLAWELPVNRSALVPTRSVSFANNTSKTFYVQTSKTYRENIAYNSSANYSFKMTPAANTFEWGAFDNAHVYYSRLSTLSGRAQDRLQFESLTPDSMIVVAKGTPAACAWDVTSPVAPRAYEVAYGNASQNLFFTNDRTFSSGNCNQTVVFEPSRTLHSVELVGEVENQDLHGASTPDMLIIAAKNYRPYAERIAQLHRDHQGLDVLVVDQELIFNEFSSGTPHAHAYRRLAKMFYDRDPLKFRHMLLLGNASFDNRGITLPIDPEKLRDEYLLTYECEDYANAGTHATAYVSDDYFGLLADDYTPANIQSNPMLINVGRLATGDQQKAANAANKIEDYLLNPPTSDVYNRAIMMSDDGDANSHLEQSEEAIGIINEAAPTVTVVKGHNSLFPWESYSAVLLRTIISNALTKGAYYWSYSGHGNPTYFGGEYIWSRQSVAATDYNFPPFAMLSTCSALNYDASNDNVALDMLFYPKGGAIALVAAAREVFLEYNQDINTAMVREFYAAKPGSTLGDVYRMARNRVITEHPDYANGINNLCYNFAGDPALPMYAPHYDVKVQTIDGFSVDAESTFPILPLQPVNIEGIIADEDGNCVEGFNGEVALTLYDSPRTLPVLVRASTDKAADIQVNSDVLVEVRTNVVNGHFAATILPPTSFAEIDSNRLSLFAISTDKSLRAVGSQSGIVLGEYDASIPVDDTSAPVISEMYLDDPSFINGQEMSGSFTLYATIQPDPSGLNTADASIGTSAKLSLDGTRTFSAISSSLMTDGDGVTRIEFPVMNVNDGRHELTLSVSDNVGNRSSRTVSFVTVNRPTNVSVEVAERPARTEANFTISNNFSETPSGRLVVENANGEVVHSAAIDGETASWDLKDLNGQRVPRGLYKAYAILNVGLNYGSSPHTDLIIID